MKALCLALVIPALLVGQPAKGPIAGSWTATFEGKTFIRLELKTVNGAISGGLRLGSVQVDPQGNVKRVEVAPLDLRHIYGVTRDGAILKFFMKEGNDPDQFELRLLENGDADLHFLFTDADRKEFAAEGVPIPKPIRLTKAG